MPYIVPELREPLQWGLTYPRTAGELNFLFTYAAIKYVNNLGLTYDTLNAVVGAFESAKAEFQRRVVNPYEDQKIKQNGDLAWPQLH